MGLETDCTVSDGYLLWLTEAGELCLSQGSVTNRTADEGGRDS